MSSRGLVSIVVLALAVASCRTPRTSAPPAPAAPTAGAPEVRDLLARVPADTPYLYAVLAPPPPEQRNASVGLMQQMMRYVDLLATIADDAPDEIAALEPGMRVVFAAATQFSGKSLTAIGRELGIDPDARMALYGRGVWPVVRIELADGRRLHAAIAEVLARADVSIPSTRVDDAEVRRFEVPDLGDVIVAIEPRHATIALAPTATAAAELLAPAAAPLDLSALLAEVRDRTGLSPIGVVSIDVGRLASTIPAVVPARDRACAARLGGLLARFPRILGAAAPTARDTMVIRTIVELDAATVAALAALERPVPHWPDRRDPDAVVELGVGLDVGGALRAVADAVEPVLASPPCVAAGTGAADLATVRAIADSFVGTVTGASIAVFATEEADGRIDGLVALATPDPAALVRELELQVGIPFPGGPPRVGGPAVEVDPEAAAPLAPVWVQATHGTLLVSFGELAAFAIDARAAAPARPGLFVMRSDAARMEYNDAIETHLELTDGVDGYAVAPPRPEDYAHLGELTAEARLRDGAIVVDIVQRFALDAAR